MFAIDSMGIFNMEATKENNFSRFARRLGNICIATSFAAAAGIGLEWDLSTRRLLNNAEEELAKIPFSPKSPLTKEVLLSDQYTIGSILYSDDYKMPPLKAKEYIAYDSVGDMLEKSQCYERTIFIIHANTDRPTQFRRHPSPCKG